jgi:hypothetical protein
MEFTIKNWLVAMLFSPLCYIKGLRKIGAKKPKGNRQPHAETRFKYAGPSARRISERWVGLGRGASTKGAVADDPVWGLEHS